MKIRAIITAFLLVVPAASFAASKEQQEMQRDIALLQEDVRQLQSSFDKQMAAMQTKAACMRTLVRRNPFHTLRDISATAATSARDVWRRSVVSRRIVSRIFIDQPTDVAATARFT